MQNTGLYIKKPGITTAFNDAVWQTTDINCYSYALDCPEMGWTLPGQLQTRDHKIIPLDLYTPWRMKELVQKDGLIEISQKESFSLSNDFHIVAMISMYNDFHFMRRDPDGLWSEKDGINMPVRLRIEDWLEDFSFKSVFANDNKQYLVGFFRVPDDGIAYAGTKAPNVKEEKCVRYPGWQSDEMDRRKNWHMLVQDQLGLRA